MFGFCEMEMFVKGGMSAIVDRWIGRWFVKSLSENGIFCVYVIGYKRGYNFIFKLEYGTSFGQDLDIQDMIQDLQAEVQDLQASSDMGCLFGTPREQAGAFTVWLVDE